MNWVNIIWYNVLLLMFGKGTVISRIFLLDKAASGNLPGHYTTPERYMVWIHYLHQKSKGKKCTFREVELEHFKEWQEEFEMVRKKYLKD